MALPAAADTRRHVHPLRAHGPVTERGVQPGRHAHRHRQRGPDGEGVGRADGDGPARPARGTRARCTSVAFSPDGTRIVTGSDGQDGEGVGRADGQHSCSHSRGTRSAVSSVAFSPDGTRIVTGSRGQDGEGVGRADGHGPARPQGAHERGDERGVQPGRHAHRHRQSRTRRRRCGTRGRAATLLDLKGHTSTVIERGVQPGRHAHRHRQLRTRRRRCGTRGRGQAPARPQGAHGRVRSVAFSPDGTRIVTGE